MTTPENTAAWVWCHGMSAPRPVAFVGHPSFCDVVGATEDEARLAMVAKVIEKQEANKRSGGKKHE